MRVQKLESQGINTLRTAATSVLFFGGVRSDPRATACAEVGISRINIATSHTTLYRTLALLLIPIATLISLSFAMDRFTKPPVTVGTAIADVTAGISDCLYFLPSGQQADPAMLKNAPDCVSYVFAPSTDARAARVARCMQKQYGAASRGFATLAEMQRFILYNRNVAHSAIVFDQPAAKGSNKDGSGPPGSTQCSAHYKEYDCQKTGNGCTWTGESLKGEFTKGECICMNPDQGCKDDGTTHTPPIDDGHEKKKENVAGYHMFYDYQYRELSTEVLKGDSVELPRTLRLGFAIDSCLLEAVTSVAGAPISPNPRLQVSMSTLPGSGSTISHGKTNSDSYDQKRRQQRLRENRDMHQLLAALLIST
jgi:hypothetical protein